MLIRRRVALTALTALLALSGLLAVCGVDSGDATASADATVPGDASSGSSTTTAPDRSTTTVPKAASAVAPAKVPSGYRPLTKKGVAVGIAVPKAWEDTDLDPDDLADSTGELSKTNPQLGGMAGAFGSILGDATLMGAQGGIVGTTRPAAIVIQTDMTLPSIPDLMVEQTKSQLESAGASDVEVKLVPVHGLDADARALDVSATMSVSGVNAPVRELIVPTENGLAIVVIGGADRMTSETILSTVGA